MMMDTMKKNKAELGRIGSPRLGGGWLMIFIQNREDVMKKVISEQKL
jgi:hypothetical protein